MHVWRPLPQQHVLSRPAAAVRQRVGRQPVRCHAVQPNKWPVHARAAPYPRQSMHAVQPIVHAARYDRMRQCASTNVRAKCNRHGMRCANVQRNRRLPQRKLLFDGCMQHDVKHVRLHATQRLGARLRRRQSVHLRLLRFGHRPMRPRYVAPNRSTVHECQSLHSKLDLLSRHVLVWHAGHVP